MSLVVVARWHTNAHARERIAALVPGRLSFEAVRPTETVAKKLDSNIR